MLNVNYGKNGGLLKACRPLMEYAWLVEKIRENKESLVIEGAIDEAINSLPVDFEIRQFLIRYSDQTRIYAEGACMRRLQP